jgi:hypothetical protein
VHGGNLHGLSVQPDVKVNNGFTSFGLTSQATYRADAPTSTIVSNNNNAVGCYVDLTLQGSGATFPSAMGLLVGEFTKGAAVAPVAATSSTAAVAAVQATIVGHAYGLYVHKPVVGTYNYNAAFLAGTGDAHIMLAHRDSGHGLAIKAGSNAAVPRAELTLRSSGETTPYPSMVIRATGAGGGFFEFDNLNTAGLPNSAGANGGLALSWNNTATHAEVNFWNTYTVSSARTAGFDFLQLRVNATTGVKSAVQLMTINSNGLLLGIPNLRLNPVTTAPSGTIEGTAGDIRVNDDYIYVRATTGWRRVALSAF